MNAFVMISVVVTYRDLEDGKVLNRFHRSRVELMSVVSDISVEQEIEKSVYAATRAVVDQNGKDSIISVSHALLTVPS